MFFSRNARLLPAATAAVVLSFASQCAAKAAALGDIFVIDMENHNFTQPGTQTNPQQIYQNSEAPYQNSLITPGNTNASNTAYASNYTNVAVGVHPSEPNYLWQESGSNFGVFNDNDPYTSSNGAGGNNVNAIQTYQAANPTVNTQSLSGLLQSKGVSWKSYQEDTDLATNSGADVNGNQAAYDGILKANPSFLTSTPVSPGQATVPLASFSGTSAAYTNPYNLSHQYNFAAKHDGQLFNPATNGGNNPTVTNPLAAHYAPLQQLTSDLNGNSIARYNLITPDQYNDSHSALASFSYNGHTYTSSGGINSEDGVQTPGNSADPEEIAQGDNFLRQIVPQIEASSAFNNNGAIVIWWDETEGGDTPGQTLEEIVISPLAKGNAFNSALSYTHSSDLRTLQEIYQAPSSASASGFLNDAGTPGTSDLSNLFVAGTIPTAVPEPTSIGLLLTGTATLLRRRRRVIC